MSDSATGAMMDEHDRTTHVLIIDDSEVDLEVYARFLKKDPTWSFKVSTTTDEAEFFELLLNESVDLVLMDYSMPQVDGLQLMQTMKSRLKDDFNHLCVVMMTGQGSEKIAVEAMKNGASDYISKNVITADFLQKTIKDSLHRFYLTKELTKAKDQIERDLIFKIALKIRQSLDLDAIVQTAVEEIQKYLQCDRVFIYRLNPSSGVLGEAINPSFPKAQDALTLLCNLTMSLEKDQLQTLQAWDYFEQKNLSPIYKQHLQCLRVQSRISIPLFIASLPDTPWGLLIADFCDRCYTWQPSELKLLEEIGLQLALGIQQSLLLEELKKQRDLATQSEKAKSAFLANMSHEIRTPMTAILGAADLLVRHQVGTESQYLLDMIRSSGKHLLELISNILDLSKLESNLFPLSFVQFSLRKLLKELVDVFQPLLQQKGLTIAIDLAEDVLDRYTGDPVRLKQIFYNLIGNAIKFTPQGQILISIQNLPSLYPLPDQKIQLYCSISDQGIGISPEDQGKLFKPFSQVEDSTTRNFQGSGLGLSICKRLVELMGGKIGVNSCLSGGTTIWFTVQLHTPEPPRNSLSTPGSQGSAQISIPDISLAHINVLVAEDNAVNQQLIGLMLKRIGCQCDITENGKLVLEKLRTNSYDIILMDCQMPVLDGYQTTQLIRQLDDLKLKNVIVIGLTAYALEDDRQRCLNAGMNDYLAKPYTLAGLQGILHKWASESEKI
jgi:signal transduction histidine kinase/DNA-binding response OmpR family regulator